LAINRRSNNVGGVKTFSSTLRHSLRAEVCQANLTPPVYLVSEADAIADPTAISEYGAKVRETLAPSTAIIILRFGAVKQKAWMGTRRLKELWSARSTAPPPRLLIEPLALRQLLVERFRYDVDGF